MDAVEARRASLWWTVGSLAGIAGWIGATVYVAATNEDQGDYQPVLRAFAVSGAVFFAAVFGTAAVQMRRRQTQVTDALYERLAGPDVAADAIRSARRATGGVGPTYLLFAAVTTALVLLAIGLGEDGPTAQLYYAAGAIVLVWLVYMACALRRVYAASDVMLKPLGLRIVEVPGWANLLVSEAGGLTGQLGIAGERNGRPVSIIQRTRWCAVAIEGTFEPRTLTSPTAMAALTGEPPIRYRRVHAEAGTDGVSTVRRGNGAGRYVLHDLLLAECLAASTVER